ncbi:MAG: hypothetical protein QW678_01530 [Candidatus Aenigmatarchaeota archaeon]
MENRKIERNTKIIMKKRNEELEKTLYNVFVSNGFNIEDISESPIPDFADNNIRKRYLEYTLQSLQNFRKEHWQFLSSHGIKSKEQIIEKAKEALNNPHSYILCYENLEWLFSLIETQKKNVVVIESKFLTRGIIYPYEDLPFHILIRGFEAWGASMQYLIDEKTYLLIFISLYPVRKCNLNTIKNM